MTRLHIATPNFTNGELRVAITLPDGFAVATSLGDAADGAMPNVEWIPAGGAPRLFDPSGLDRSAAETLAPLPELNSLEPV